MTNGYARIQHAGGSWIDTRENAARFIAQCLKDRDDDYEVTLPEFAGP